MARTTRELRAALAINVLLRPFSGEARAGEARMRETKLREAKAGEAKGRGRRKRERQEWGKSPVSQNPQNSTATGSHSGSPVRPRRRWIISRVRTTDAATPGLSSPATMAPQVDLAAGDGREDPQQSQATSQGVVNHLLLAHWSLHIENPPMFYRMLTSIAASPLRFRLSVSIHVRVSPMWQSGPFHWSAPPRNAAPVRRCGRRRLFHPSTQGPR